MNITNLEQEIEKVINSDYDHETPDIPRGKAFNKVYRQTIKKLIKPYGLELLSKKSSAYCESSGFITDNKGNFVWFNSGDYRFDKSSWKNRILIRTAQNAQDYRGGGNHYTSIESFGKDVFQMINKGGK